jgi:hypothetical protein
MGPPLASQNLVIEIMDLETVSNRIFMLEQRQTLKYFPIGSRGGFLISSRKGLMLYRLKKSIIRKEASTYFCPGPIYYPFEKISLKPFKGEFRATTFHLFFYIAAIFSPGKPRFLPEVRR